METPLTLGDWQTAREEIRVQLWRLLGDLPPLFTPQVTVLDRSTQHGCIVEKIVFDNGVGAQVYGYLLLPPELKTPAPAVLYLHAHGGKYGIGKDEIFQERTPGTMPGTALVEAGYVVLAIDAYCFGERQTQWPAGDAESGAATEQALFKHFLWQGSTLWGMMVRDDLLALNVLAARPEVDPARIGVTGMSLGGSRTTWLAALDQRPQAVIPVCQMTRYRDFADSGRYNLHSIYYYVPGMLKSGLDMEHLVALAAPRTQAILIGDSDPLSPLSGIKTVQEYTQAVYRLYNAQPRFTSLIEPGIAHQYTPTMFAKMLETFNAALRPQP